jgi:nucleotide-binding universal stress UspA family protein
MSAVPSSPVPPGQELPTCFVVPLDGSDYSSRAVPVVSAWATRFDVDVFLTTTPATLDGHDRTRVPSWLESLVAGLGDARVKAIVADVGDPVAGIDALLEEHPGAVVAMATHGRGTVATIALGSVAQRIVREVRVPTMLVGRSCVPSPMTGPVVVCHDGSDAADAVLPVARAWAKKLELPIELVHVFHPLDVASAEAPTEAVHAARDFLGAETPVHVVRDSSPANAIDAVAHRLGASLIAMSTHGRTGLARLALGSVAMGVVRASTCPILTIHPTLG